MKRARGEVVDIAVAAGSQGREKDARAAAKPRLLIFIVAYFAESTIANVFRRIPPSLLDTYDVEILVIDDASGDRTFATAHQGGQSAGMPFKVTVLHNPVNQRYGGNQKIGYRYAIEFGFDFVALLHGDGQYAPECLPELVEPVRSGAADAVMGSRMMRPRDALRGGMPLYKFVGNRVLTTIQNRLLGTRFSELHSGYRVYSVAALAAIPFDRNTNDFHFDTEIVIQLLIAEKRILELPIPTYYGDEICRVNGIKYAKNVVKASLHAWLQRANIFYDRRYDCAPPGSYHRAPAKLDFSSTHSRVLELVPAGSSVLDLGAGSGAVALALHRRKGCRVVACDLTKAPGVETLDRFLVADLDAGLPDLPDETFDYILALDVLEHLKSPDSFLDELRALAARTGARVIVTTGNIGFVVMRLSLLAGRFEYGKRGILDLTHARLFTFATLRRALIGAGFEVRSEEGVVVPWPFVFGKSALCAMLMAINRVLIRLSPRLFGFQMLFVAEPRPTLEMLLSAARVSAGEKEAALAASEAS
jgi:glycosyltransferase involved in cell wall biosynthesis